MSPQLKEKFLLFSEFFEKQSVLYFDQQMNLSQKNGLSHFWSTMKYTFFLEAKRFRPYLSYLVCDYLKKDFNVVFPYALATELIHTYSLIHDDLPIMDNDDLRRGKPSNHKVYGEDMALLAGDALQAEAFRLVVSSEDCTAQSVLRAVHYLSSAVGVNGMVGGQVLDIQLKSQPSVEQIEKIHLLKTGCLIQASVMGAAILLEADQELIKSLELFSQKLGLAFQVKDDLLDYKDEQQDYKNFVNIIGFENTEQYLKNKTNEGLKAIQKFQINLLEDILRYNYQRVK